jgi:hypothetical protein
MNGSSGLSPTEVELVLVLKTTKSTLWGYGRVVFRLVPWRNNSPPEIIVDVFCVFQLLLLDASWLPHFFWCSSNSRWRTAKPATSGRDGLEPWLLICFVPYPAVSLTRRGFSNQLCLKPDVGNFQLLIIKKMDPEIAMNWVYEIHFQTHSLPPRHWLFSVLKSLFSTLRPFKSTSACKDLEAIL